MIMFIIYILYIIHNPIYYNNLLIIIINIYYIYIDIYNIGLGLNNNSYSPIYSYVMSMYINERKGFAFVELPTMELATACLSLDGILYMVRLLYLSNLIYTYLYIVL